MDVSCETLDVTTKAKCYDLANILVGNISVEKATEVEGIHNC